MTKTLNRLFFFFTALYLIALPFDLAGLSAILKITPIGLLLLQVTQLEAFSGKLLLTLALVFSAIGDTLLEFNLFIFGLAAFLLAQLQYATYFVRSWQSISTRWPLSLLLVIYVLIMVYVLTPHLGDLHMPVFAYLTVIAFMGLLAAQSKHTFTWTVLGAIVFIASDSIIAIDKFIRPVPLHNYFIMITYYAAQWMIITGCINQRQNKESLTVSD